MWLKNLHFIPPKIHFKVSRYQFLLINKPIVLDGLKYRWNATQKAKYLWGYLCFLSIFKNQKNRLFEIF